MPPGAEYCATMSGEMEQGESVRLTGVNTRKRRALDEWLLVRFPGLTRGLLRLWSRLPRGSRLRRVLLLRFVSMLGSAVNRRGFDVLLLGLDPEIDYRAISVGPGGGIAPDLVGHHYGHQGYLYTWRALLDAFDDVTLEPEELLDMRLSSPGLGVPPDPRRFVSGEAYAGSG